MEETMETYVLESSETLNNNFENKAALLKEIGLTSNLVTLL